MDVLLPRLGEGADSGTVVGILVSVGDQIRKEQPILELETEKAVGTIPAPEAGTVTKIHVKQGDKISVGQLILSMAGGNRPENEKTPVSVAAVADRGAKPRGDVEPNRVQRARPQLEQPTEDYRYESKTGLPPPASPSIRKMARDLGVDLTRVKGSEPSGRIKLEDVQAYIRRLQEVSSSVGARHAVPTAETSKPVAESIDFSKWGPVTKKPISSLRRIIAERMVTSWTTIPHVTQFDEADISTVLALKNEYDDAYKEKGARLTVTSFVLKAVVGALKKHPIFNASLDETTHEIVLKEYYHIGIAVDTEAGLIVPVLRDVDKKSMLDLSKELDSLAEKTRQRKVTADELKGGSFTISNQGGIGGAHFTPIVNKPEVAILGLGRSAWKPVVKGGKIEPRMMLPLALSYDHRLIDGANAARFIVDLVQALENFSEAEIRLE